MIYTARWVHMGLRPSHFPTGTPASVPQSCPQTSRTPFRFSGCCPTLFQEKRRLIRKLALEFTGKPLITLTNNTLYISQQDPFCILKTKKKSAFVLSLIIIFLPRHCWKESGNNSLPLYSLVFSMFVQATFSMASSA